MYAYRRVVRTPFEARLRRIHRRTEPTRISVEPPCPCGTPCTQVATQKHCTRTRYDGVRYNMAATAFRILRWLSYRKRISRYRCPCRRCVRVHGATRTYKINRLRPFTTIAVPFVRARRVVPTTTADSRLTRVGKPVGGRPPLFVCGQRLRTERRPRRRRKPMAESRWPTIMIYFVSVPG